MKNEDKKNRLILEYSEKVQALVHELETKIKDNIRSCMIYYGDIIKDGVEIEGTKMILSVEPEIDFNIEGKETEFTPQDIIKTYHVTEYNLKQLMLENCGLNHISNLYLKLIELEKQEARKALGERFKEYHNLL